MAHILVMRSYELGKDNAQEFWCRSHLGHLLKPGDLVMGLDVQNANPNDTFFDELKKDNIPDVILVKKVYDKQMRGRKRNWKLKRLNDNMDTESMENDFTEFLEDLEEDPAIRQNVIIYKDRSKVIPVESLVDADEDIPQISLQEMMDDLHLSDVEMSEVD